MTKNSERSEPSERSERCDATIRPGDQPAPAGIAAAPAPVISVFDAIMITVGIVIGAGIFQTPTLVAQIAGSPLLMMSAWVLGGVLSFVGALTYAELATTWPSAGGDYTFLRRAYGRDVSFLFAWARSTVIVTGSIALLGFILGDYLTRLFSLGEYSPAVYAALAVAALTAINLAGLSNASRLQNVLTVLEIGGVLLVAVTGLALGSTQTEAQATSAGAGAGAGAGSFGLAMIFVLLTYGGWNEAAYVSAEVRGGARAMIRTLLLSIAIITLVYLLFVAGVLYALGFEQLQASEAVGIQVIERMFGPVGGQLIGVIVTIAALTSMNSTMIVGARTNYAVAQDWPVFSFMGQWRGDRSTPVMGFMVQAAIALALIAFGAIERGGFATLVEFTAPVFWFFFMLSGIALFVLRSREPAALRPFKVPFYPVLPMIFVVTCAYLLYSSVRHAQSQNAAYVALGVMLSGLIVWAVTRKRLC